MSSEGISHGPKVFLIAMLLLQSIMFITTLFDLQPVRQFFGFAYLTFVPGFIAVNLLGLNELDWLGKSLFSIGLSVAFLILGGLFVNQFGVLLGIRQPMSLVPLILVLNVFSLVGAVLVYLRGGPIRFFNSGFSKASLLVGFFICLPILSIFGASFVNSQGNSSILLLMIAVISVLFVIAIFSRKLIPQEIYPFVLIMIAVAILYHSSFISRYMVQMGSDVALEGYIFETVKSNAYWSPVTPPSWIWAEYGRINSMLSVTILPTVYSTLLNLDVTSIYKILFPLVFAFVPLGLYSFWETYLSKKYAFISVFLFMAQATFYNEMPVLGRQMIGELFLVFLLLVIVNKKMKRVSKIACFVIFSFALITSHYALAEILLGFLLVAAIYLYARKRPNKIMTVAVVLLFFVMMFAWYIFTSKSAVFDSFLSYADNIKNQLGDFFDPASRGKEVLRGLGLEAPPTIWNAISRVFAYVVEGLIVVGFVGVVSAHAGLAKRTSRIHLPEETFVFTFTAMALLAALIVVPGLANTLNMSRFFHILLFFLAPLCIIGAESLVRLVFRKDREFIVSILLTVVIVTYFLFQTGFVYEIVRNNTNSIPLGGPRMDPVTLYFSFGYVNTFNVFGAEWLPRHIDVPRTQIYLDDSSPVTLMIYGTIFPGYMSWLSNTTIIEPSSIVYLNTLNVVYGKTVNLNTGVWNSSELYYQLHDSNLVYNSGGNHIFRSPP